MQKIMMHLSPKILSIGTFCNWSMYCLQFFDSVGWAAGRALEWWGAGVVRPIYLERGADLHMAQLMPLPRTVSCFSKIQIGFTFPVPAYLGSPGKRAVKRVCVTAVNRPVRQKLKVHIVIVLMSSDLSSLYVCERRFGPHIDARAALEVC